VGKAHRYAAALGTAWVQLNILSPLTLALSLREGEQLSTVGGYSLDIELLPALGTISLSLRERAGVRGSAASD